MSTIEQQTVSLIRTAIRREFDSRYQNWVTGKRTGENTYLLREAGYPNRVYVRPTNDSYEARLVWGNAAYVNIPVIIRRLAGGDWQLDDIDYVQAGNIGSKVDTLYQPPVAGDGAKIVLPGYNLRPFRLRIDSTGGLTAYVEPGFYIYNGTKYYFPGGTVDLTSAVPGTASTWRWVWVGVTPVTHAIVTATSTPQSIYESLTIDTLAAIATDTDIDSGGVKLRNAQTVLGIVDGDFADTRQHYDTPQPASVSDFIDLGDVPSSYSGAGSYVVAVNSGATGLEFVAPSTFSPTVIGTKYDPYAPPASASAEDDEFDNSSLAGAWSEFDHASTMTVSEDAMGVLLAMTTSGATNVGAILKSLPSGDFTIETCLTLMPSNLAGSFVAGIVVAEGTGSTDDLAGVFALTSYASDSSVNFHSHTAYNANPTQSIHISNFHQRGLSQLWVRITRATSTYGFYHSEDGRLWTGKTQTVSFTPAYMGLAINGTPSSNSNTVYARFAFFRYTNTALAVTQSIGGRRVNLYA